MVRNARISRTKAVFVRTRKHRPITAQFEDNTDSATHEHATPSIPIALQTVLRKPLQTSHAKKSRKIKRKTRDREQSESKLCGLLQQRIVENHSWAGGRIHPIALLSWLAAEESFNSEFLLDNADLLMEGSAMEVDPVLSAQLDDIILQFVDTGITDAPSSQDNPLVPVPKDFSMVMTPFSVSGHQDHDAIMSDCEVQMSATNKLLGAAEPIKPTKHGFDPVQVLKKHAITFRDPLAPKTNNLTSEVHVLFREENFHGCPQHIYEVLKPGLRLASLLLTHRATSTFWHTAMFGRREPNLVFGATRIVNDVPWSEEHTRQYDEHLARLAGSLHFHFSLWPTINHKKDYSYGSMHPIKDHRMGWQPKPGEPCRKSRIRLHTDFYTTAKRLSLLKSPDPLMVLRFNLLLASVICHELAHFLEMSSHLNHREDVYAIDGTNLVDFKSTQEPFMNDYTFNEMGVAFETKIFGGRIEPISCRIDCAYGITTYDAQKPNHVRTFFTVPMDYVSMLQQQEMWEQDFSGKDWTVFHIPRDGAKAVSVPYFDMTVWEGEDQGNQISDILDQEGTPFRRAYDGRIVKADRNVKTNH